MTSDLIWHFCTNIYCYWSEHIHTWHRYVCDKLILANIPAITLALIWVLTGKQGRQCSNHNPFFKVCLTVGGFDYNISSLIYLLFNSYNFVASVLTVLRIYCLPLLLHSDDRFALNQHNLICIIKTNSATKSTKIWIEEFARDKQVVFKWSNSTCMACVVSCVCVR